MATAFAFLGMLLASLVVALLAAMQLGDFFRANDEFVLVIGIVAAFGVAAMAVLALTYALTAQARSLNAIALLLALAGAALVSVPGLVPWIASHSTNPYSVGTEQTAIRIEIVLPELLAVLVQWGLVRRRWLRMSNEMDVTRWPWVATAVAGLVILNPIGLAFVAEALAGSRSGMMWQFTATVTGIAFGILVVIGAIECYIRGRVLRRRQDKMAS